MESIVLASELDTSANTQDGSSATGLNLDVQNVAKAKVVEPPAPARITPKPFVPRMPPGLGMWSSSARSSKAPSGLGESLTIGLPPTEESQERIRKLNPGRYAFENPETARTFSNPKNVVDSFDDIENMGTFERLFKDTATSKDRGLKVLELSELGANLWQGEGYDPVSMAEIERVKREMEEIPDFPIDTPIVVIQHFLCLKQCSSVNVLRINTIVFLELVGGGSVINVAYPI